MFVISMPVGVAARPNPTAASKLDARGRATAAHHSVAAETPRVTALGVMATQDADVELAPRDTAAFIAETSGGRGGLRAPARHAAVRVATNQGPGLALELGVGWGTTLRIIAVPCPASTGVIGFDCFTGLPETWRPGFPAGTFAQAETPVVPGAQLVVGMFETTSPAPWS